MLCSKALIVREPERSWLNKLANAAEVYAKAIAADWAAVLALRFMGRSPQRAGMLWSILVKRESYH